MTGAERGAVTGAFGALGALTGGAIGAQMERGSRRKMRDGAVIGAMLGALVFGGVAGAGTLGPPQPATTGVGQPPRRFARFP
jgi:hypothetical protein